MPTPQSLSDQINRIVCYLIEVGLSDDQNLSFVRSVSNDCIEVTFPKAEHVTIALRENQTYESIYETLIAERAYIVKLPDGAMVLARYIFRAGSLLKHSLGFYPSPSLAEFQNNSELYLEEMIYADVVAKNIVPFPIRFDFDCHPDVVKDLEHPASHQTLGQYKNCRIPVSAPMTPFVFFSFILRNFYNTAFHEYAGSIPRFNERFDDTITAKEKGVVFVQLPSLDAERVVGEG
jgi:hypothetical protein